VSAPYAGCLPGALVVSLDFELHWGVRAKHSCQGAYARNLHGARTVVPRLLELFQEFGVAATWATVGFLFAASREELEQFSPVLRPAYRSPALSPYAEPIGANEDEDPLHLAPSLIQRIRRTQRQEIGTHTFSHYYCGEEGQTRETFRADLAAASAIAAQYGIQLRSIVFPRNQHNPAYDDILWENGIRAYRGNPHSSFWHFANAEEGASRWKRAGRALDAYLGIGGHGTVAWEDLRQPTGLSDVRASCLLRPYRSALRYLEPLRLERVLRGLRYAARTGRIFHLWWHPHNFGVHHEQNLAFLRHILVEFATFRDRHGMRSVSMADVDDCLRVATENHSARASHAGRPSRASVTS
jgi:peptidoglycan/xylan/chitin deacetylase (PgdA/CDA1 family)